MLLGPVLVFAVVRRSRLAYLACVVILLFPQLEQFLIFLPGFWGLSGPRRVWLGKLLELLGFLWLCIRLLSAEESGVRWPTVRWAFSAALGVGLLLSAPEAYRVAHGHLLPPWRTGADILGFEATLPGLAEEVSYRGFFLGALDHCLGRPWRALGVEFGPGAIVTSLMFALAHVLFFDRNWRIVFFYGQLPELVLFALTMCWLRYRTRSVWPSALAHNVNNSFEVGASMLRMALL
jgi:membrane protease YdiL (CAAX protease family)